MSSMVGGPSPEQSAVGDPICLEGLDWTIPRHTFPPQQFCDAVTETEISMII